MADDTPHSRFGGSVAKRWLACPGSVSLSAGIPDTPSKYAREGTVAHMLAERCLKKDLHPKNFLGETFEGYDDIPVTAEMCDAVLVYLEAVTHEVAKTKMGGLYVEKGFTLDLRTADPGEVFGTNDALVYHHETRRLVVFDYKHGAGVAVDVEDNPQLKFYAVGALMSNPDWPVEEIELVIVQPRAVGYGETELQPVRRWTFDVMDLLDFAAELERGVARAKAPEPDFATGDHCRWCPAAAVCPAKEREAVAAMNLAVASIGDITTTEGLPAPEMISLEALSQIKRGAEILNGWVAQIDEYLLAAAMRGEKVPGFKLVEKVARRKWIGSDEEIAAWLSMTYGLDDSLIYPRKIVTITEAERLLKAELKDAGERKAALDALTLNYTIKESSGVTLAPESDRRSAVDLVASATAGLNLDGLQD